MIYSASIGSTSVKDRQSSTIVAYNDDSIAHLLANTSATVVQTPAEIYEDITQLDNHEEKRLTSINENHYIDDPTSKNVYCYIKMTDDGKIAPPETLPPSTQDELETPKLTKKNATEFSTSTPNNNLNSDSDYYKVPLNNTPIKIDA